MKKTILTALAVVLSGGMLSFLAVPLINNNTGSSYVAASGTDDNCVKNCNEVPTKPPPTDK